MAKPSTFRTRADFLINNRWQSRTWNHNHGNKHTAIIEKAHKLNATRWDFGNADHGLFGQTRY